MWLRLGSRKELGDDGLCWAWPEGGGKVDERKEKKGGRGRREEREPGRETDAGEQDPEKDGTFKGNWRF